MTYTLFCFFRLTICIPFFIRKILTFYRTVFFLICKMYTFDQYFWLEITNTYTTQQSIFCSSTIHPINAQNLQTLITFSVLLQLKREYENIQIKANLLAKVGVFNIERTSTVTYFFICLLNSALTFLQYM